MKSIRFLGFTVTLILILVLTSCTNKPIQSDNHDSPRPQTGQVYLYGEAHSVEKILDRELELWYNYYHEEGMRHLFVELPYYTAELLNIWLQSDNDEIFDGIYEDWEGTYIQSASVKEFYKDIKEQCPETIFHGTDVGFQYSTGKKYLKYLEENNLKDSKEYISTEKSIEQGKYYRNYSDEVYRENMMVENFIEEFDKLKGESIMGIYGAAHTGLDSLDHTDSVPCMANQLKETYGDIIHSEDLSELAKDIEPYRLDIINVNGKDYEASYFGKQDLSEYFKDYSYREFWRLENSYEYFAYKTKTGAVQPNDEYPMLIEKGQVFVIDLIKTDGSVIRKYFRSDGYVWEDMPSTEEFTAE